MSREYSAKKIAYNEKLISLLEEYSGIIIVHCDNVGSHQMQQIRIALRGSAEVLMGKNTMMRRIIRDVAANDPRLDALLPEIVGNVGMVFTNDNIKAIKDTIEAFKVPAAAKSGTFAPVDVFVPPGPTGMDPGQTGFFQSLGIATKIVRGAVEIINEVHLITKGEKVGSSEVALLSKLNIKPFSYGLKVVKVYDDGSLYDPEILDIEESDMLNKFFSGVSYVAAMSLVTGIPTLAGLPHSFANAFKYLLAIAVTTDYSFPEAEKVKAFLDNPDAFVVAAPAAGDACATAEPEEVEEEESSSSSGAGGLGLFGDSDSDSDSDSD